MTFTKTTKTIRKKAFQNYTTDYVTIEKGRDTSTSVRLSTYQCANGRGTHSLYTHRRTFVKDVCSLVYYLYKIPFETR